MRDSEIAVAEPRDAASTDVAPSAHAGSAVDSRGSVRTWVYGLGPVALLVVLVWALLRFGPLGIFEASFPPVEELTIERVLLPAPNELRIEVVNGGPETVTIAQVVVDDGLWRHGIDGPREIGRLETRTITIPYPWVEGEQHVVRLVTSTGVTFDAVVPVATQTPTVGPRYLTMFAVIGAYVGVLPVLLGLLWLPFLRRIGAHWIDFFLAFTVGLLAFLGFDALGESIGLAATVPGAFQGPGLVVLGVFGAAGLLAVVGRPRGGERSALYLATLIALGIGLHNFGEGLAIGGAYAAGEVALGTFLVLGFLIHNTTEGLAIVAPLARRRAALFALVGLGLLAGLPTIAGTWIGGFTYSPTWVTLFFAIGAGAIAQVVLEIGRSLAAAPGGLTRPLVIAGGILGMLVMYATGIFVSA